uniref:Mediator of RNA polymerase II transcription subunit 13 n=1 Tax=Ditylenchus dipsaci TaxID=166011 RepID=A0A915DIA8_9BILA
MEWSNGYRTFALVADGNYIEKEVAPVSQVISACLVSTEPELHLRIFPGSSENGNGNGSFSGSSFQSSGPASSGGGGSSKSAKSKSTPVAQALGPATGQEEDNDFVDFFTKKDHEVDDNEIMDFDMNDLGNDAFKNESDTVIDNQPMATGYYISTAPALDLPEWFGRRNIQQSEEFTVGNKAAAGGDHTHHPLDATSTDEALKYVLETYMLCPG